MLFLLEVEGSAETVFLRKTSLFFSLCYREQNNSKVGKYT